MIPFCRLIRLKHPPPPLHTRARTQREAAHHEIMSPGDQRYRQTDDAHSMYSLLEEMRALSLADDGGDADPEGEEEGEASEEVDGS